MRTGLADMSSASTAVSEILPTLFISSKCCGFTTPCSDETKLSALQSLLPAPILTFLCASCARISTSVSALFWLLVTTLPTLHFIIIRKHLRDFSFLKKFQGVEMGRGEDIYI